MGEHFVDIERVAGSIPAVSTFYLTNTRSVRLLLIIFAEEDFFHMETKTATLSETNYDVFVSPEFEVYGKNIAMLRMDIIP